MRRELFDRPGLGLVIQLAGFVGLPHALAQVPILAEVWSSELAAFAALELAVLLAQVAVGLALSYRPRATVAALVIYAVANVATIAFALIVVPEGAPPGVLIAGFVVDVLGIPAVIVAGALLAKPAPRSAGDVAVVLLVGGVASVISTLVFAATEAHAIASSHEGVRAMVIALVWPAGTLVAGAFQLAAGIAMARRGWPRGRRTLLIYIVVSVGGLLLLQLVGLIAELVDHTPAMLLASSAIQIAITPLAPLAVWWYARRLSADDAGNGVTTAGWIVALLAPVVGGRIALLATLDGRFPIALAILCAAQAITNIAAGVAAIRESRATSVYAITSLVVAVVLAVAGSTWLIQQNQGLPTSVWAPVAVAVASGVLVWACNRRARSDVPST